MHELNNSTRVHHAQTQWPEISSSFKMKKERLANLIECQRTLTKMEQSLTHFPLSPKSKHETFEFKHLQIHTPEKKKRKEELKLIDKTLCRSNIFLKHLFLEYFTYGKLMNN